MSTDKSRRHQYDSIYKCLPFTYSILFHAISTETGLKELSFEQSPTVMVCDHTDRPEPEPVGEGQGWKTAAVIQFALLAQTRARGSSRWFNGDVYEHMGMDQYLLIPFLVGWTSIYQLFWCSPGVQGFDTLPYQCVIWMNYGWNYSPVSWPNPNGGFLIGKSWKKMFDVHQKFDQCQ